MTAFYKVSLRTFLKDWEELNTTDFCKEDPKTVWENLKLPQRATSGSAGYDFFSPFEFYLNPWREVVIPTGIKFQCYPDQFLLLTPRSGQGSRFLRIANTVGVIDSDYFGSPKEGHITASLRLERFDSHVEQVEAGKAYMQGIILESWVTDNDRPRKLIREGGHGSTDEF